MPTVEVMHGDGTPEATSKSAVAVALNSNQLGKWGIEGAALLVLVVATVLRSIANSDLVFGDETSYLRAGLALMREGQTPGFTGGALYVDMYGLLSLLVPDEVGLYFAGRAVAASAFVLGVWLASRLLAGQYLAWPAGAVAASLPVTYVWPGVPGLAAGLLLVAIALVVRFRSPASFGLAAGLVWLASAARPEYVWLAVFMSVGTVVWFAVTVARRQESWSVHQIVAAVTGAALIPLTLVLLHGSPFATSRSWVAFSQHFSLRNAAVGEDPWLDAGRIVARIFPQSSSLLEALAENPSAIATHVLRNVWDAGLALQDQVLGTSGVQASPLTFAMVAALVLSLAVSLLGAKRSEILGKSAVRLNVNWRSLSFDKSLVWVTVLFAVILAIVPILLIFPRDHYLMAPAGMALVGIVALQRRFGSPSVSRILPLTLVLALFALSLAQTVRAVTNRVVYPAPIARSVALMAQSDEKWVLLSGDWGVNTSLDVFVPGVEIVPPGDIGKDETMGEFMIRRGINSVWRPFDLATSGLSVETTSTGHLLTRDGIRLDALFPGSMVFLNQTGMSGVNAPAENQEPS